MAFELTSLEEVLEQFLPKGELAEVQRVLYGRPAKILELSKEARESARVKDFELQGWTMPASPEETSPPRNVTIALVQNKVVLPTDAPVLEQMRNRHEAVDEPLCELGSDLFDVSRAAVSLAVLVYCGWIVHSLKRGLLDAAAHGATGRGGGAGGVRMLQRVTSLAKYTSRAQTTEHAPTPCLGASGRPSGAEAGAGGREGAAPAADPSPHSSAECRTSAAGIPSSHEVLQPESCGGAEEAAAGSAEASTRGKSRHRSKRLGRSRGRPPAEQPGAAEPPRSSPTRLARAHRILARVRSKGRESWADTDRPGVV